MAGLRVCSACKSLIGDEGECPHCKQASASQQDAVRSAGTQGGTSDNSHGWMAAVIVVAGCIGMYFYESAHYNPRTNSVAHAAPPRREAEPAKPVAVNSPTPAEAIMRASTVGSAISYALTHVGDDVTEIHTGSLLLSTWLRAHPQETGELLVSDSETSLRKIKKDYRAEQGKTLCVSGRISQIEREHAIEGLYAGTMVTSSFQFVYFMTSNSTGELTSDDYAKFCGASMGIYAYANVSGGQTQSVHLVGAFDIADNRLPRKSRRR